MSTAWLIALTVFYFTSGIAEAFIAKKIADDKGHNGFAFFAVTCFSNVLGLLCACVIKAKDAENKGANDANELNELKNRIAELEKIIGEGEARARTAERERAERAERERMAAEAALAAERRRAAELAEREKRAAQERATSSYYDDGEASSLGWQVSAPSRKENSVRKQSPAAGSGIKANSVLKDGRLVCSNCLSPIKFNDKVCKSCGADIVPVDGSDGGFFRKK